MPFVYLLDNVQFSSVTQSCPTLWDPMNRSTPGLPVHHQLLEFTQTHIHRVSDAIHLSHPPSSPSPPAPNPSQHQSLFQWVNFSHEVAKVLEFQPEHHSLQRNPRADLLQNGLVGSPCSPVQFSSVTQSCPTLWDPMNCSTPGLPVRHQLQDFTQTHVHIVNITIYICNWFSILFPTFIIQF